MSARRALPRLRQHRPRGRRLRPRRRRALPTVPGAGEWRGAGQLRRGLRPHADRGRAAHRLSAGVNVRGHVQPRPHLHVRWCIDRYWCSGLLHLVAPASGHRPRRGVGWSLLLDRLCALVPDDSCRLRAERQRHQRAFAPAALHPGGLGKASDVADKGHHACTWRPDRRGFLLRALLLLYLRGEARVPTCAAGLAPRYGLHNRVRGRANLGRHRLDPWKGVRGHRVDCPRNRLDPRKGVPRHRVDCWKALRGRCVDRREAVAGAHDRRGCRQHVCAGARGECRLGRR
mmetsp:Transcript_50243/g.144534  ORF Transcript_50243/g.144534 Transcript_50243/m.144534 type:complete len:287 (+) Transcript_50243:282-1142(+)